VNAAVVVLLLLGSRSRAKARSSFPPRSTRLPSLA
jgi:hypothetical protein